MEISLSTSFKKAFKKRIKSAESVEEFWLRIDLFILDPFDTKLKTHKLSGKLKDLWSFSFFPGGCPTRHSHAYYTPYNSSTRLQYLMKRKVSITLSI